MATPMMTWTRKVHVQWEGGGTHTGPAFEDFLIGSLPTAPGRKVFSRNSVLKVVEGGIVEEIARDDGVVALIQLGVIAPLRPS